MSYVVKWLQVTEKGVDYAQGAQVDPSVIGRDRLDVLLGLDAVYDTGAEVVAEAEPEGLLDPLIVSTEEMARSLDESKATGPEVVAHAQDDPKRARLLLDAEELAHGGDPRQNVAGPLQKIIDQGDGA